MTRSDIDFSAAISHWVAYARAARRLMRWDREVGIWPKSVSLKQSPGWHQADTAMRTARAVRLEKKTGKWHCACCLKPAEDEHYYWRRNK